MASEDILDFDELDELIQFLTSRSPLEFTRGSTLKSISFENFNAPLFLRWAALYRYCHTLDNTKSWMTDTRIINFMSDQNESDPILDFLLNYHYSTRERWCVYNEKQMMIIVNKAMEAFRVWMTDVSSPRASPLVSDDVERQIFDILLRAKLRGHPQIPKKRTRRS